MNSRSTDTEKLVCFCLSATSVSLNPTIHALPSYPVNNCSYALPLNELIDDAWRYASMYMYAVFLSHVLLCMQYSNKS